MIIRQNPILSCEGDDEARHFCAVDAKHSIDAIAAFWAACPRPRSSGYFLSTALVECIFHLVFTLQDPTQSIHRQASITSFWKACKLLRDFASIWIIAKRALQAISSAIFSGGDANALFEALARPGTDQSDRMEDTPSSHGGKSNINSRQELSPNMNFDLDLALQDPFPDISQHILSEDAQNQCQMRDLSSSNFVPDIPSSYADTNFEHMLLSEV